MTCHHFQEGADDTDSKWAHFQSYARRVRKIILNPFHDRPPVWNRFSIENVCLRSLHTVEVYGIYNEGNVDTSLLNLVPESTRVMNLRVFSQPEGTHERYDPRIEREMLAILKGLCTRLEDLEAVTIRLPPGGCREAVDLESLFIKHHLHSITVIEPMLPLDKLYPLCEHSSLTALSFTIHSDAVATTTPLTFQSVQNLTVQGSWISINAALISLFTPRVCAIKLVVDDPYHKSLSDDMSSCCAHLASDRLPALDDIQFVLQEPMELKPAPGSLIIPLVCSYRRPRRAPFPVPVPLLQLRGLRSVSMQYSLPYIKFICTPDALRPFAQAWPGLENLCLTLHDSLEYSLPSLCTTLLALAEHCSRLRTVQLPAMEYEDGAMERAEAYAARRNAAHELQGLQFGHLVPMDFDRVEEAEAMLSSRKLALLVFPHADIVINEVL